MTSQLEMFTHNASDATSKSVQEPRPRRLVHSVSEAEMVAALEATERYRILRKLEPRSIALKPRDGFPNHGVIVDTETTGLESRKHEIIEIGLIRFSFSDDGNIGDVLSTYHGLQQPTEPIPADISRLTGITDETVLGQKIDTLAVDALVAGADLIIAHNAGFDRPFCEAFLECFADKAWACSVKEIDWSGRGYEGTKLGYLVAQSGYFHDGHRALDDCFALLEVLSRRPHSDEPTPFTELYETSLRSRVRIYAENSPFDLKDLLKARGYRWSDGSAGTPRSWWIEVIEEEESSEIEFLRREIYQWEEADPLTQRLSAFERFR